MATLVFLGTGTSHGVPIIGCKCAVCTSTDPHNKRTRTSALIEHDGKNILIDASIDFRQQALREMINHLDAILITHGHADHIFGLDEMRRFNVLQGETIACFAEEHSLVELRRVYEYFWNSPQSGGGVPDIRFETINGPFEAAGVKIVPLRAEHGAVPVTGYRIGSAAYLTDCNEIPDDTLGKIEGIALLVLDGLRWKEHPTHFNLDQAIEQATRIGAERTCFVHMTHDVDHQSTQHRLPKGMALAYDGLRVEFEI